MKKICNDVCAFCKMHRVWFLLGVLIVGFFLCLWSAVAGSYILFNVAESVDAIGLIISETPEADLWYNSQIVLWFGSILGVWCCFGFVESYFMAWHEWFELYREDKKQKKDI